jgi:uncharacterized protein with von Willebrand factor type A (vWA) domain
MPADPGPTTYNVDLAELATAVGQRLHQADMPVTPHQSEQFARALQLTQPASRVALYHMTRAIFVTDVGHVVTFDRVFAEVFGAAVPYAGANAARSRPARAVSHA